MMKKKVQFCNIRTEYILRDWPVESREARKSYWMRKAQDRVRFENHIRDLAPIIQPVLEGKVFLARLAKKSALPSVD